VFLAPCQIVLIRGGLWPSWVRQRWLVQGIDSQLVAFRASPNESVSIDKPGQGGRGAPSITVSIVASGANPAAIDRLDRSVAGVTRDLPRIVVETVASSNDRGKI
jgi:hypothetical protein